MISIYKLLEFQSLVRVVLNEHNCFFRFQLFQNRFQSLVRVVLNEHRTWWKA